jgi:SAM-dependent methyltransferase
MLALFALTLFVSATLLFVVQPLFAKMILPLLGGAPAVWNTCMVFYQAALLAGYAYAHLTPRWLGVRRQALLHLALLLLVALTLPLALPKGWSPPAASHPIPWLLLLLTVSVGLPFLMISTTAPLLQKWFAHTRHAASQDPYFLYGASNLGSMLALLGYPVVVEPLLRLKTQTWVWMGGYLGLVALIAACAVMLWRAPAPMAESAAAAPSPPPAWGQRLWWVALAFAPSSLLLGVTSYISTDLAAVPLLWVIPLSIYLLTFVLVFSRKPLFSHEFMVRLMPLALIPLAILFFLGLPPGQWQVFPLHLLAFFLLAMVCHGELMLYRPGPEHLTEFYFWMSVGGVLGGLFNALLAPQVFSAVIEYPLIIVVASMLRPIEAQAPGGRRGLWDVLLPAGLALILIGGAWALPDGASPAGKTVRQVGIGGLCLLSALACYSFRGRPRRFGLGLGAVMLAGMFLTATAGQELYTERNFFGILKVKQDQDKYRILSHGTTIHGAQSLDPSRRREPLNYYYPTGPLGQVFTALGDRFSHIAGVGLGAGAMAAYGRRGQEIVFYEIDPGVERIARDPRYFTFLSDSAAKIQVVLGDARLSLVSAPDHYYDLIVLDAFSSDAIPLHLISREALALYLAKLKPGGVLACHISNHFLDLKPVLGNLAQDAGLTALVQEDTRVSPAEKQAFKSGSVWVVMARQPGDLGSLTVDARWRPLPADPQVALWTDDFSNIFGVFKWHAFKLPGALD